MCDEMELEAAAGDTQRLLRDQPCLPRAARRRRRATQKLEAVHAQLIAQMGRLLQQVRRAARRARAVGGRAPCDPAAIDAGDADAVRAPARGAHRGAAAGARCARRGRRCSKTTRRRPPVRRQTTTRRGAARKWLTAPVADRVRREPEQPRAADRSGLRPAGAARSLPSASRSSASTRSGSATACSRSPATRR